MLPNCVFLEAEEEAYYKKIEEDRRKKFDSKSRTKHRGKDKVTVIFLVIRGADVRRSSG